MNTPFRFSARAVSVLVIAGVGLTGCSAGSGDSKPIFTYNGTEYTAGELRSDLKAYEAVKLAGITDKGQIASTRQQFTGTDANHKAWNSSLAAGMINQQVFFQTIDRVFKADGLQRAPLTADEKSQIIQGYGGQANYDKLPKSVRDTAERIQAEQTAIVKASVAKLGTPKAYFEAHKDQFGPKVCASHILVATEDEAKSLKAAIEGGASFEETAKAKSTDPGSGAQGGDLGCTSPTSYVPEFASATMTLPLDTLSDPVKTQFGYHLIKVTSRPEGFEAAKADVEAALTKEGQSAAGEHLINTVKAAKIWVDPAFGRLVDQDGIPTVTSKTNG